ncbi:hypothetical protein QR680_009836 [Steinernema hermaphroditum]|uniref:Tubulin-specific chaperone D n=1 Tax=Steinernema hermaphroditum TaxID=289476 RepID=A0AA39IP79_9BILA|nr:hypothetical protein QR680_009836 [Steinernema hermaphroditum]
MVTAKGVSHGARECSLERREDADSPGMEVEASELDSVIGCIPNVLLPLHHQELCDQIGSIGKPGYVHAAKFVRFRLILDMYHTQPNLLDPAVGSLVESLLAHVKLDEHMEEGSDGAIALSYIHYLAHIRGYKVIIRYLPHDVFYMEKLLRTLEERGFRPKTLDADDIQTENYCNNALLLWLYIVAKNPFDLMKFDEDQTSNLTMKRIVAVTQEFLKSTLNAFSAALILSHVVTRSDGIDKLLSPTISTCIQKIKIDLSADFMDQDELCGQLILLCAILKSAKRTDVVVYAPKIFEAIQQFAALKNCNNVVNHLVAKWRYSRGCRSIADNLMASQPVGDRAEPTMEVDDDEEFDCFENIPEGQLEAIIDVLLKGLCHSYFRVRWSAAKGIGRIASRLPLYMAKDIVAMIMSLNFNDLYGKDYWHGGCMALAELTRRGCILPEQLVDVIPLIKKALVFEEPQGRFALGENVRDAACYICWAFARAYEPQVLAPYIQDLATELVNVALFDREVTVRRAASAAYQENVGRLGTFPNGLSVLTIIDYFAVGRRALCFGELCTQVARFSAYALAIANHLTHLKFRHWDEKIRNAVSGALKLLVPIVGEDYFLSEAVPYLLKFSADKNVSTRHGAIFAISGIMAGLSDEGVKRLPVDGILDIADHISQRLESRTTAIDAALLMRAASKFVRTICEVGLEVSDEKLLSLVGLFDRILSNENESIRENAIPAVRELYRYFEGPRQNLLVNRVKNVYFSKLHKTDRDFERIGAILPFLCLPISVMTSRVPFEGSDVPLAVEAVHHLSTFIYTRNKQVGWTTACRYAVKAVAYLTTKTELDGFEWNRVFDCLMCALDNYTTNEHGDVGSFIRGPAIDAFEQLLPLAATKGVLQEAECTSAICGIVQQASEKINWLRKKAFEALGSLVGHQSLPIKERELLLEVTSFSDVVKFHEATANSRVGQLLASETYGTPSLHGLMISAGDLSESTRMAATKVLVDYVETIADDLEKMEALVTKIVSIFTNNVGVRRITTPFMIVISELLNSQLFWVFEEDPDRSVVLSKLVDLLNKESVFISKKYCASRKRIVLSALCGFLQFKHTSTIWKKAFEPVVMSLRSSFPPSRREGAQQLYEVLLGREKLDESTQKALDLLSGTSWHSTAPNDVAAMKLARLEIKELLLPDPATA